MSNQILTVLSPWAAVDVSALRGLSPRPDDLNGKTIGMFGDFMILATYMLHAVEEELRRLYPGAKFSYLQYVTETTEIRKDAEFSERFDAWAEGVDCILSFYGSVPSSSLYLGYNTAYMEKLGKPAVMLVVPRTYSAGLRGVKAGGVPGVRIVQYDVKADKVGGTASQQGVIEAMAPDIRQLTAELADALTRPLTDEERRPTPPDQSMASGCFTGTARELGELFYSSGWTNGQPIELPTREAVDEMLTGTDLPPDTVIGYLPPKMGVATVEKIAVNAVMAGCLPTYLPVLIAAVEGALNPCICLEGWTCSQSTWGPVLTLSGRVVEDIGLGVRDNALSPYWKPNATIGRAFGYIMMNIAGLRPAIEDLSEMGHENRLGFCMGDNTEESPWGPLHEDFGLAREDSAVTLFWPMEHRVMSGGSIPALLEWLCSFDPLGWDPGAALIFTPNCAKLFADAGWTKKRILDYIVEYDRRPASRVPLQWLVGNNHPPQTVDLPEVMTHSTRVFWDDRHMFALVAGGHAGNMITVLTGGGDHGGPSCTRLRLPADWENLVKRYADIRPHYIDY